MSTHRGLPLVLALTSVISLAISGYVTAPEALPGDLESEVGAVMAENAALREQLRRIEEQQRALMEVVQRLQIRLDGTQVAEAPRPAQLQAAAQAVELRVPFTAAAELSKPPTTQTATASATSTLATQEKAGSDMDRIDDRYKDGFVLAKTDDGSTSCCLMTPFSCCA